ncbi:MAG: TlpA family protein disulfide reductase [Egibacteraceae bacterium]
MRRVLVLALLVLAVSACASGGADTDLGYISGKAVQWFPVERRQAAPAATGRGLDGRPLALADYVGMPVVLNFWASWCGPCAREAPEVQAVSLGYEGRVQVLGVDVADQVANARTFERDLGVTYPSFYDPSVRIAAQFRGIAPQALPTTLVLDAEHRVAVRHFGAVTGAQLRGYLERVLGEAGVPAGAAGGARVGA